MGQAGTGTLGATCLRTASGSNNPEENSMKAGASGLVLLLACATF